MKGSRSSTRKKVVIRKLDKNLVKGYLDPESFITPEGVEVLDLEGRLLVVPLDQIKGVYFVRDFDGHRERTERKIYLSRPRMNGLWVRMRFKDAEVLDGLISQDLLSHQAYGFDVTLPDVFSNNLKIFIPRGALAAIDVLDVISNGGKKFFRRGPQGQPKPSASTAQIGLFPSAEGSEAS